MADPVSKMAKYAAIPAPPFDAISFPLDELFPFPDPLAAPEGAPAGPGRTD